MPTLPIKKERKPSYLRKLLGFYFAPVWQSFFTIFYFVFFFYFSIFHSGKIVIASNFALDTFIDSVSVLSLDYLFWGVIFLISLIIPFSISLYAIILFYEVWSKSKWIMSQKILTTVAIVLAVPLVIMLMDNVIRTAAQQEPLQPFIESNNLQI